MANEVTLEPVELAVELTIAWLGNQNNRVIAEEVPAFLRQMFVTISDLADNHPAGDVENGRDRAAEECAPAVSVRKSLGSKDHIISMIDGKPYKTLRRHISRHGLTPDQYRKRYNLKSDYPMVAESYSEARRAMAHKIGLGVRGRDAKVVPALETDAKPSKARKAPTKAAE